MLRWSNAKYKMTLGIGSLALTVMMADLWRDVLSVWVVIVVVVLPLALFVLAPPGELPARAVWIAHVVASVWYMLVAGASLAMWLWFGRRTPGWQLWPIFVAVGAIPCGLVLYLAARGRYLLIGDAAEKQVGPPGNESMKFAFLTHPEVEGAAIRWDNDALKSPALVAAALAAGFSEEDVRDSPLGVLEQDFQLGPNWMFRRGARTLIGINGCTLVEVL